MDGRWDAVVIGSASSGLAAATMGGMMAAASVEPRLWNCCTNAPSILRTLNRDGMHRRPH